MEFRVLGGDIAVLHFEAMALAALWRMAGAGKLEVETPVRRLPE